VVDDVDEVCPNAPYGRWFAGLTERDLVKERRSELQLEVTGAAFGVCEAPRELASCDKGIWRGSVDDEWTEASRASLRVRRTGQPLVQQQPRGYDEASDERDLVDLIGQTVYSATWIKG
jgi:hypothetical protein